MTVSIENLEKDKKEQTERLIKAVISLDKRFVNAEKKPRSGIINTAKDSISTKLSDMFSVKGVSGALGIGGFLKTMIDSRHEGKVEKRAEAKTEDAKARKFADSFSKYTAAGFKLQSKDRKAALAEGTKKYQERKTLAKKISENQTKIKEAREIGAPVPATLLKELKDDQDKHDNFFTEAAPYETPVQTSETPVQTSETPVAAPQPQILDLEKLGKGTTIRKGDKIGNATVSDVIGAEDTKTTESFEEMVVRKEKEQNARKESPASEKTDTRLVSIAEEQLEVLKKLESNSSQSEEDKSEANIKPMTLVKEKIKEKTDNMFGDLFGSLGSMTKMIGNFLPMIGGLISAISPLIAIVAAATGGYMLGSKVINPLLDKAAKKLTGDETVGGSVDTVINGDVAAQADRVQSLILYKVQKDKPLTREESNFLKKNVDKMNPRLKEIYKEKIENKSRVSIGLIAKPEVTQREAQTLELEHNQAESRQMQKGAEAPVNATSIQNNTTNNTNIKQTSITPPVRNVDSSFNNRLSASFS